MVSYYYLRNMYSFIIEETSETQNINCLFDLHHLTFTWEFIEITSFCEKPFGERHTFA